MTDPPGAAVLLVVVALLGLGLLRQFAVSGPRWALLDRWVIVPQWKFFGLSAIVTDPACFDDFHLFARHARADLEPGVWQEVLWSDERRWGEMLWNPGLRCRELLIEEVGKLATGAAVPPTALAYLTVLRLCLDKAPLEEGEMLQFAVAATRGRGERRVELRFVSGWHIA